MWRGFGRAVPCPPLSEGQPNACSGPGAAGLSTEWITPGNRCWPQKNGTAVTGADRVFHQSEFNEGGDTSPCICSRPEGSKAAGCCVRGRRSAPVRFNGDGWRTCAWIDRLILFFPQLINFLENFKLLEALLERMLLCAAPISAWMRKRLENFKFLLLRLLELISKYAKGV